MLYCAVYCRPLYTDEFRWKDPYYGVELFRIRALLVVVCSGEGSQSGDGA